MYLRKTVPVELPAGAYYNGACLTEDTEVNLDACSTATQCLLDPPLPPCIGEIEPTLTEQKLCDLVAGQTEILACLETLKNNPIAEIDGSLVDLKKCTLDGRPLVFYAATNEQTGEVTFTTYVLEAGELIPYEGTDCVDCNQTYIPTGETVTNNESQYCDEPVYLCFVGNEPQGKFLYVGDPATFTPIEDLELSDSDINVPTAEGSKVFESEILDFIQVQATTPVKTVQDALDAMVAAGLPDLVCKETGQTTPATIDDICAVKVTRLPCKALYLTDPVDIATQTEVGADDAYFVGGISVNTAEDTFGTVDPTRPVAAGVDAVASWCAKLERKLSKADIAAL